MFEQELLDRLEFVQGERDVIRKDLEVQQDARRRLQDDVLKFEELEKTIVSLTCFRG